MSAKARDLRKLALCWVIISLSVSVRAPADQCAQETQSGFFQTGLDKLNVTTIGDGMAPDTNAVNQSITQWNECGGTPTLQHGGSDGVPVTVVFHAGASTHQTGACAVATRFTNASSGALTKARIDVWEHGLALGQGDCSDHYSQIVAHELGHVLGLGDSGDPTGACRGRIMSDPWNSSGPQQEDCEAIDELWLTNEEVPSGLSGHPCSQPPF